MDIGLREWLIVIGLIVIAGILFDGWRRMRGGKGKLKFKLDRSFANLPDDDGDSAELLGPARVVEHREPSFDEQDLPSVSAREAKGTQGRQAPGRAAPGRSGPRRGLALEADPSDAAETVEPRKGQVEGPQGERAGESPCGCCRTCPGRRGADHQRHRPRRERLQGAGIVAEHPRERPALRRHGHLPSPRKHGRQWRDPVLHGQCGETGHFRPGRHRQLQHPRRELLSSACRGRAIRSRPST